MPQSEGETLQIKHTDPDKAARFRARCVELKVDQHIFFERMLDHAFEAVSKQLKEEKEERKEKENIASKRSPRRRNGMGRKP